MKSEWIMIKSSFIYEIQAFIWVLYGVGFGMDNRYLKMIVDELREMLGL